MTDNARSPAVDTAGLVDRLRAISDAYYPRSIEQVRQRLKTIDEAIAALSRQSDGARGEQCETCGEHANEHGAINHEFK